MSDTENYHVPVNARIQAYQNALRDLNQPISIIYQVQIRLRTWHVDLTVSHRLVIRSVVGRMVGDSVPGQSERAQPAPPPPLQCLLGQRSLRLDSGLEQSNSNRVPDLSHLLRQLIEQRASFPSRLLSLASKRVSSLKCPHWLSVSYQQAVLLSRNQCPRHLLRHSCIHCRATNPFLTL